MEKVEVYDMIIALARGCNNKERYENTEYSNFIKFSYNAEAKTLWATDYLLNQLLRALEIPKERKLVSEKAKELWNMLEVKDGKGRLLDINNFSNHQTFVPSKPGISLDIYIGAEKEPREQKLTDGKTGFHFNDVFHEEHIVPVKVILDEIIKTKELDYEKLDAILKKMYVCRMLKKEDRNIKAKYKRSSDYKEIINNLYKDSGIEIEGEHL